MDNILFEKVKQLRKEKMGITKIAQSVNRSTETIREYLVLLNELPKIPIRGGGRKRKYHVDDDFFNDINTEMKAYVLGLIFADGCVHKRNNFSITLKSKDRYLLENVNIILKSNFPIVDSLERYSKKEKYTEKSNLSITSKKIISNLEKIGCVQRKSDILKFPIIDEKHMNHFMRGYFDGDGSVFTTKQNDIRFSIISTKEFCDDYLKKLPYKGRTTPKKEKRTDKNVYYVSIGGKNQIKLIYNFLYNNSNVFLERKHIIFKEYFSKNKNVI